MSDDFSNLSDPDAGDRGNPLLGELSGASLVDQFCAEFPNVSQLNAIEYLAWMDARLAPPAGVPEEKVRALVGLQRDAWHLLISYQSRQKCKATCPVCHSALSVAAAEVKMSTAAMAMELGHYTAAGADNVADLARKHGLKKATVNKCALTFQQKLKLPPREGQRDDRARQNMTAARNHQLTPPTV